MLVIWGMAKFHMGYFKKIPLPKLNLLAKIEAGLSQALEAWHGMCISFPYGEGGGGW